MIFHPTKTIQSDRDISDGVPAVRFHRLWAFAERMHWEGLRPRWFWSWLLRRLDAANGYRLEYLGDGE